jgi:hypothetical protein
LFQGLVAGLLRPRPSLKQIEQSSSSGKFCERHRIFVFKLHYYFKKLFYFSIYK